MPKKLLPVTALCFMLAVCNNNDLQEIELIVVSKTKMVPYTKGNIWTEFFGFGGYMIGLSRNGKEPAEYIWYADNDGFGYGIINAEVGDKGTVSLREGAKERNIKLPRPNAEEPPTIGMLGEVQWVKQR